MLNILIRTSYRPNGFKKTLESINQQSYKNIRIIVSYDDERALSYIPEHIEKIRVYKNDDLFFYDNYCNTLKSMVNCGWFFFLDDGDVLSYPLVLEEIRREVSKQNGLVVQFSRNGKLKPSDKLIKARKIERGKIGMPCLVLHHSHKNKADFDGSVGASDYIWIKEISKKVKLKFRNIVLVHCGERDGGKMESI